MFATQTSGVLRFHDVSPCAKASIAKVLRDDDSGGMITVAV